MVSHSSKTISMRLKPPKSQIEQLPVCLTIAGSDPSGGAGIEADLKTFAAHNVYGATCITGLTSQNTQKVKSVVKTAESHLKETIELLFDDFLENSDNNVLKTIKTGMLTEGAVKVIDSKLEYLGQKKVKLIIDPVMISTSGFELFGKNDMTKCYNKIIQNAFLVTPNLLEAQILYQVDGSKCPSISSLTDFVNFAIDLQKKLGCENILLKGGHIPFESESKRVNLDSEIIETLEHMYVFDVLYQSKTGVHTLFKSEYYKSANSHGTGCTLSSSLAANLAKGIDLEEAVALSIDYVHLGFDSMVKLGKGNGPLNHNVKPQIMMEDVIQDDMITNSSSYANEYIFAKYGSFSDYFKNHPEVSIHWQKYINHPFINLVARGDLKFDRFLYFLKQDYHYLINYAQVLSLEASKAPEYPEILGITKSIEQVIQEIEHHKAKLNANYGIDYVNAHLDEELQPGKACIAYCSYLLDIGTNMDYISIKTAMAPCLFGYHEAAQYGKSIATTNITNPIDHVTKTYNSWLDEYVSDWYVAAYNDGVSSLDKYFKENLITHTKLQRLVSIFKKVTQLEVEFWDEVLNH